MNSSDRLFDTKPFERAGAGTDRDLKGAGPDGGGKTPLSESQDPAGTVVRVLPDVSGLDKTFDYMCPPDLEDRMQVGSMVRVELHGRRVGAWVVGVDTEPPPGVALRPIAKFSSIGPPPDVVDLARWTAHLWSGRLSRVLKAASPGRMVPKVPAGPPESSPSAGRAAEVDNGDRAELIAAVFDRSPVVGVQLAPTDDQRWLVTEAAARGDCLVLLPEVRRARNLVRWLQERGIRSHLTADNWAGGFAGGVVVGSRSAVWAPVANLRTVLVLDEHDESFQEERSPTWHARDVALERARRSGAHCILAGPCLSVAARSAVDHLVEADRQSLRAGWPAVELIDRRNEEPGRAGLFSSRLVQVLRETPTAVLILNRKGRARLLVCASCGEVVRTEDGEHPMVEMDGSLVAPATGERRPLICARCTGTALKRLRLGVARAAEELGRLVDHEVEEVTSDTGTEPLRLKPGRIVLGTEAALFRHHYRRWPQDGVAGSMSGITVSGITPVVAFLDMDQEIMAPRYRAAEQAMILLTRAARLVGGRGGDRRILVQTRNPEHRSLQAAVAADPTRMAAAELEQRLALQLPPVAALAEVSGRDADELADRLMEPAEPGIEVFGPRPDGRYLVRGRDWAGLADVLASVDRSDLRCRVAVDPPRA